MPRCTGNCAGRVPLFPPMTCGSRRSRCSTRWCCVRAISTLTRWPSCRGSREAKSPGGSRLSFCGVEYAHRVAEGFMKLYPLLYPGVIVFVVPVLIIAYYMGVRRSASSAARNTGIRGRFLKVLLLVCLTCVAIAALSVSAANPANHRGPSVSFAYVQSAQAHYDTAGTLRQLEAEFMKAT